MDDQDKLSSLGSKLLAFLSNVRKTLKLLCSPNDYILLSGSQCHVSEMNLGLLHSDTLKKITGAVDYNKQFLKK